MLETRQRKSWSKDLVNSQDTEKCYMWAGLFLTPRPNAVHLLAADNPSKVFQSLQGTSIKTKTRPSFFTVKLFHCSSKGQRLEGATPVANAFHFQSGWKIQQPRLERMQRNT